MGFLIKLIGGLIGSALVSGWRTLFPPKTAADQRVEDLAQTAEDARDANKTEQEVGQKSRDELIADLAKRMRNPNT